MAWSHIQLFYHTTKDSRVGTMSLYSSTRYRSFRVPTSTIDCPSFSLFTFVVLLLNLAMPFWLLIVRRNQSHEWWWWRGPCNWGLACRSY
jgi:hypothetical protein